ncbi:MAG: VCBS repeat-containing protein [Bacteroidetes bacterium]|nr:VCBS repeat-containing protein [Bacteroidota bacterium]
MKFFVLFITLILFNGYLIADDSLRVINVFPVPQSISAEPSTTIEVQFNIRVDPTSFTDTTFMVWGRWSGVHKGTLDFNSIGTIAYLFLDKDFFYGEWVTVSLSKGIKDAMGNNLSFGYAWNFWIVTTEGTLDLTRTAIIEVRENGEGQIQTYGTYAGDFNGDGWSDFFVPNEISNDVRVFMNDNIGNYGDFTIFKIIGGSRPSTNEGMDFNMDGIIDVAVGNSTNNMVTVFIGDGTGGFSSIQNYAADEGVRGLSVIDVNGDGFMDIVTANRNANNVSILINNGDGSFASPVNFDANGNGETACAAADVNGDGIMDLYVGAKNSNELILFMGDGNGGFTFSSKVTVGTGPWMITAGDVNNDGVPDVVSANSGSSNLSVVFADANGNLSAPVNYSTGSFPIAIDLGDIDGDGDLEVVTSNFFTADYTMYENDGTGNYINRRNFDANSAGSCVVLHDRDNDGDMDMTGIDEVDDLLILFTNDKAVRVDDENISPGMFSLSQNYPNPFNPSTKIKFTIPTLPSGQAGSPQSPPYQGGEAKQAWFIQLVVYDILGKEIATLVNKELPPGEYEVDFSASGEDKFTLPSGIYFYQLRAGDSFVQTKKMILLR